jgi:hypothetical protein
MQSMLVAIASALSPGHPRSVARLRDGDNPTVVAMVGPDIHAPTARAYIDAHLSECLRCSSYQRDSTKNSCCRRGNKGKSFHDVHTPLWFRIED